MLAIVLSTLLFHMKHMQDQNATEGRSAQGNKLDRACFAPGPAQGPEESGSPRPRPLASGNSPLRKNKD